MTAEIDWPPPHPPGLSNRTGYAMGFMRESLAYGARNGWVILDLCNNVGHVTIKELVDAGYIEKKAKSRWYRLTAQGSAFLYGDDFGDLWVG